MSDTPTMRDVSHTPPEGESIAHVWRRGRSAVDGSDSPDATDLADD